MLTFLLSPWQTHRYGRLIRLRQQFNNWHFSTAPMLSYFQPSNNSTEAVVSHLSHITFLQTIINYTQINRFQWWHQIYWGSENRLGRGVVRKGVVPWHHRVAPQKFLEKGSKSCILLCFRKSAGHRWIEPSKRFAVNSAKSSPVQQHQCCGLLRVKPHP